MHRARLCVLLIVALGSAGFGCEAETDDPSIAFRPGSQGDPDVWGVLGPDVVELWIARRLEERDIARVFVHLDDGRDVHSVDLGPVQLSSSQATFVEVELPTTRAVEARVEVVFVGTQERSVAPLSIDEQ